MKKKIGLAVLALTAINTSYAQQEIGIAKFSEGQVQYVVYADKTQSKPCPPTLPKNCEMVALEGHPKKPDLAATGAHPAVDTAGLHPIENRLFNLFKID